MPIINTGFENTVHLTKIIEYLYKYIYLYHFTVNILTKTDANEFIIIYISNNL